MDIEGGEKLVVPAMQPYLIRSKPNLYISLHWVFLGKRDIRMILDILFDIYPYCYNPDRRTLLTKPRIVETRATAMLFTPRKLVEPRGRALRK